MPPKEIDIIITSDGSHSLYHIGLNETYHSTHGAIQESIHVYISNGLDYISSIFPEQTLNVLEIGFGTGLNALLSVQKSSKDSIKIKYIALEPYPLSENILNQLNYPSILEGGDTSNYFKQIHQCPWDEHCDMHPFFTLKKSKVTLEQASLAQNQFHLIYYDAFAPSKQPEMWSYPLLHKATSYLVPNGGLVTYCAKGQVKRDLRALGLIVEELPGPPGKKEMIRATHV